MIDYDRCDVLQVANQVMGTAHRSLDSFSDHDLLCVLVALLLTVTGGSVYLCGGEDIHAIPE